MRVFSVTLGATGILFGLLHRDVTNDFQTSPQRSCGNQLEGRLDANWVWRRGNGVCLLHAQLGDTTLYMIFQHIVSLNIKSKTPTAKHARAVPSTIDF